VTENNYLKIKFVLKQYKEGCTADPPQEFSHSNCNGDWVHLGKIFSEWSGKPAQVQDWDWISTMLGNITL